MADDDTTATVNGKNILSAVIREVRVGNWSADLDLDSDDALSGSVVIESDGVQWHGSVVRGAVEAGRFHAFVVGGKGGLSATLPARHYISASMSLMLGDVLRECGEALSSTTDPAVTSRFFARWSRLRGTAGAAVAQAADDTASHWRVLRDGTLWLGTETWPEISVKYDEIERAPARGKLILAPDAPLVVPGTAFAGGHVSSVTTIIDGTSRQEVLFEDGVETALDRTLDKVKKFVEAIVGKRIDYATWYPARVVSQNGDGSVDLYPDDLRVQGSGVSRVPLRHGVPGITTQVNPGARVMLFFENNDPKQPAAALWPDGSSVRTVTIAVSDSVTIHGDLKVTGAITSASVAATGEVTALAGTVPIPLSKHTHQVVSLGSPTGPATPPPAPPGP